jgi:hypothetical protein
MEKGKPKPRGATTRGDFARPRPARGEFTKPRSYPREGTEGARASRPPSRFRSEPRSDDYGDPYQPARRPPREREAGGRGFTVNLDPDVARVFRGDASVNKALRLVMQLMQVVQGPPPRSSFGERASYPARRPYQGSAAERGFERKPRFDPDEEIEAGEQGD